VGAALFYLKESYGKDLNFVEIKGGQKTLDIAEEQLKKVEGWR